MKMGLMSEYVPEFLQLYSLLQLVKSTIEKLGRINRKFYYLVCVPNNDRKYIM